MHKHQLFIALVVTLLAAACAGPGTPAPPGQPEGPATPTGQAETALPASTDDAGQSQQGTPQPVVTMGPDCLGGEVSSIGQAIADEYEYASYEDVMTWFCNGAEFEDILIALQIEDQTGTPAEEMLAMLADGFTWEEIWLVVGLTK